MRRFPPQDLKGDIGIAFSEKQQLRVACKQVEIITPYIAPAGSYLRKRGGIRETAIEDAQQMLKCYRRTKAQPCRSCCNQENKSSQAPTITKDFEADSRPQ